MSDVIQFQDAQKRFTLFVKKEFLEKVVDSKNEPIDPSTLKIYDLHNKYYMFKFLHNPTGHAVIRHKDDRREFWIDGICVSAEDPERAKKMEFDLNFSKKIDDIVND